MRGRDQPRPDDGGAIPSLAERLAGQFYEWEGRGRGWLLWDGPVRPEPPFVPFRGYCQPEYSGGDDGREHTWLSGLIQWVSRKFAGRSAPSGGDDGVADDDAEDASDIADSGTEFLELQVTLPAGAKVAAESMERFFLGTNACRSPLSFEVIGAADETVVQLACAERDLTHVRSQLQAQFPDATLRTEAPTLASRWEGLDPADTVVVEFGLSREFVLPLAGARSMTGDVLAGIAGTLEQVEEGELAVLQVLFEPVRHPWAASVLRAVATPEGDGVFGGTTDLLGQSKAKIGHPLYAAVVRVACRSARRQRAWDLARRLGRGLDALADSGGNELIALDNDRYDDDEHARDVPLRRCRRSGMILNGDELAALVHLPSADVQSARLKRRGHRTKPAPPSVLNHELLLGRNEHAGRVKPVTLAREQRVRHTHVIGASGTGKSTFLLNLILQDVERGEGLAVLDPHGDLVDAVLDRIPDRRAADVVLFDPADEAYPIGFNVLAAHSDAEKSLLASDLVGIFRRLSSSWGDQMNAVLSNAVLAFLESDRGGTLAELRRFLIEKPFREEFLRSVRDPHVVYYWRKEFPLLVGRAQGPVLTRLDGFLRPRPIRHVVAQRDNRLNFADIMDGGKVFLARLSHGAIGEDNTYLLGSLLVSKFHQIALGRQQVREEQRRHFWLYVDEFQHFATPSMASLLSGVRKYRLGLVLAHQELHQLESRSPDVASAVLSNSFTRVCFRVGDHDARKLREGFSSFDAADLQNLGTGEAICRVERADCDFNLLTPAVRNVDGATASAVRARVVALSRERYATAREVVEAQLREAAESSAEEPPPQRRTGERPATQASVPPPSKPAQAQAPVENTPVAPVPSIDVPAPPVTDVPITVPRPIEPAKPKRSPSYAEEAVLGRGGPEHKYLQQLVKQWAEGLGYRGTIEAPIAGSQGSVDVGLEKPNRKIGCLISLTTSEEWELGSVRKCLAGQFAIVVVIAPDPKHLAKLRESIGAAVGERERARVHFFAPEEFFAFLQEREIQDLQREKTVRGYRVKASYRPLAGEEGSDRRAALSKIVAASLRRTKGRRK